MVQIYDTVVILLTNLISGKSQRKETLFLYTFRIWSWKMHSAVCELLGSPHLPTKIGGLILTLIHALWWWNKQHREIKSEIIKKD